MAGTKEIKRRIKSVKNTKKITKAMELVSASKMKKAISKTLASRLYANYSWELLTSLSLKLEEITHPFFADSSNTINNVVKEENKTDKTLMILITSNRGLCGAYNSQVIKKIILKLKELNSPEVRLMGNTHKSDFWQSVDIITVGKKGDNAMRRIGQKVIASFFELPDIISLSDITPLSILITNEYKIGNYKNVFVAYTDYISALSQKPKIKKLLPISKEELKEAIDEIESKPIDKDLSLTTKKEIPYLLEGNIDILIESLTEKLIRMQIYQMLLESNASEQSSRMVAMKNANEAAQEMINDLTLVFNKARQANITREISEISAGMASVN